MMDEAVLKLIELGGMGATLALVVYYLFQLKKSHREERREWADRDDKKSDAFINALTQNTQALSKMSEQNKQILSNTNDCRRSAS